MLLFILQIYLVLIVCPSNGLSEDLDLLPRNVTIIPESSTRLLIKWEPPILTDPSITQLTGYKIKYHIKNSAVSSGSDAKKIETVTVDSARREYQLSDLKKGTQYSVKISALDSSNDTLGWTDWIHGETLENDLNESRVPDAPSKIRLEATLTTISISWQPPKDTSVAIKGYIVGWGTPVPNDYTEVLNANQRFHQLTGLKPTNEYVISVRAFNDRGDGPPIYESIWTRAPSTPEPKTALLPPVGLRVDVISPTSAILHWTDTTLNPRSLPDNRFYTIRYSSNFQSINPKYKYLNTTKTSLLIEELKPYTQYEFAVKVTKGRRETTWSMSAVNTTLESRPTSRPEDLTITPSEEDSGIIKLDWQPPRQPNGLIIGYVILYTTDKDAPDKDWAAQPVVGGKLSTTLENLLPDTIYYFKIQVRNKKGYGPLSDPVMFRTLPVSKLKSSHSMIFLISSISGAVLLLIIAVSVLVIKSCRQNRHRHDNSSRKHNGYIAAATSPVGGKNKSNIELKPPDLWIRHNDQIEVFW